MQTMQDIEIYRKIYDDAGMVTIPLVYNSKIPVKGLALNDVYDGYDRRNVNGNDKFNIGIVTGKSGIVVFDCDTAESVAFFQNLPGYVDTAKVVTRRGMHFYYRVPNAENIHPQRFSKGNIAIDLKAGRSYVVAPPSIVDGHRYTWDPDDWTWTPPITEISDQEFFAIIEELKEFCSKNEQAKIDTEKIIEVIRPYYVQGQRQDIVLGLAGVMKKARIEQEIALEIVAKLAKSADDSDPIQQRFSAVINTYQKKDDEIAGWSMLEKVLGQEDIAKLKNIIKNKDNELANATKIIQTEVGTFALLNHDWYLFFEEKDKKGKKEESQKIKVCPYFWIPKSYRIGEKVAYKVETEDATFELSSLDYMTFEQNLGRPILNLKYAKILLDEIIKASERVFLYDHTGWINEKIFSHPLIKYQGIETSLKNHNKLFKRQYTEEQHEFIRAILHEGKFLAAKIVFAVASLFCKGNGFTVIDVGERGIGKTLTSILAINIFYDARTPSTCYSTKTAMELHMRTLANLPILLDEVALSYDDHIQSLVFMTASGKGKARANTSLTVNIHDLSNVVFLTGERELEFDRLGAFRRFVAIKVLKTTDYTELFDTKILAKKSNLIGAGTDYILYLLHNDIYIPEEERFLNNFQKFSFINSIEKAMIFLEKFYNQRFENTRKTITKLLADQHSEVEKSIYDIFVERLSTWIVSNHNAFIKKTFSTLDGQEVVMNAKSPKIFGYIDEIDKKIYILGNAFKNFCKEENLPCKTVLLLAKEKGALSATSENFRVVKHIPIVNVKASCYCFNLLAFNLKELDGNR